MEPSSNIRLLGGFLFVYHVSRSSHFLIVHNTIKHNGDYDDFVYCDKEMLDNLYPQAELFIHTINQLLKEE